MKIAKLPDNETARLASLLRLDVLDTLPQKAFDDITTLASAICGTPIALISLVDSDRQWFKSKVGLDTSQTPREVAFCSHAILNPDQVMVVEDARHDPRFRDNPLVTEAPDIRFYAGAPIVTADGFALGTVCVIDRQIRQLDDSQRRALQSLASLVVALIEHETMSRASNHRQAEEAAKRNEYLAALSTSGLDLMSFVDANYVYRHVNNTYLKYWDRNRDDIVGKSVSDLMGSEQFEQTVKANFDQAMSGQQVDFEARIDFPGEGMRHVEVTYLPARDETGKINGVIVRGHDIQALKQREEQLRETIARLKNKTLQQERFIHIISHDLREPINTINNFSSLLAEDDGIKLSATARRNLDFVQTGGQRMAVLLDDLLNYVQLDEHAADLKPVDLARIAVEVQADLASALERVEGRIEIGRLPVTLGDASLLRIALQNLIANGLKFFRKHVPPVVTVSSTTDQLGLHIHVRDNGIGMPADQLDHVFKLFKRLHSRKEFEGTGLGLSICRRIAELHSGSLTVASELGQGSCFTFSLPAPEIVSDKRKTDEVL
jgi:PAS domain S-box-containing protein